MGTCDRTDTYTTIEIRVSLGVGTYKNSKVIHLVGCLHADICNVSTYLLSGVRVNVRLTKNSPGFYLMDKDADSSHLQVSGRSTIS
jgi:hypothetical protein